MGLIGVDRYSATTFHAGRFAVAAVVLCILAAVLVERWRFRNALRAFRQRHPAGGKDLLIVYSASPHWQPYIDRRWLTKWHARAVALNRSAPNWQDQPETALWRYLAGPTEHTPVAIVIPLRGLPTVIRFYSAFREYKHGKPGLLRAKELEMEAALLASVSGNV